jgi:hypothetical protein
MFGLINRTLLLWLNGLFWKGAHGLITVDDLPGIDEELESARLRQHMNLSWNKRRKFRLLPLRSNNSRSAQVAMGVYFRIERLPQGSFCQGDNPTTMLNGFYLCATAFD